MKLRLIRSDNPLMTVEYELPNSGFLDEFRSARKIAKIMNLILEVYGKMFDVDVKELDDTRVLVFDKKTDLEIMTVQFQ